MIVALAVAVAAVEILRSDRGVEIRAEEIATREIVSTITATGQIRPRRQVNISSDVMGRVSRLLIEEGDDVQGGDILLHIDPTQTEAQLARARAMLSQAEAQVAQQEAALLQAERERDRAEALRALGGDLISRQSLEERATQVDVQRALLRSAVHGVEQAQAGVEEARDQLARTTIRAPISGRVTRLNIDEGETVVVGTMNNPGSLLLTIGDLSVIEAVLVVSETDVPLLSVGDSAVVELDAYPGREFSAQVARIGSAAIQESPGASGPSGGSVDFQVILTLLDPPAELRSDLSATADVIVDRRTGAAAIPIISVTVRDGDGVFLVRDGRAVWTPVDLGITGQEHFEARSGVGAGDTVVSGPYETIRTLQDGDPVRVVDHGSSRP